MLHRLRTLSPGAAMVGLMVAILGVQEAEAQRGRSSEGTRGPMSIQGGPPTGVERAIRLADALELTDEQRTELEGLRLELVELERERAQRRVELGSEVRAGLVEPEALFREMQELQSARQEAADAARGRIEDVLTEEQMEELNEMARPARGERGFRNRGGRNQEFGRRRGPRRRGPGV